MSSTQTQAQSNQKPLDEMILVVKRSELLATQESWQGLNIEFSPQCLEIISKKAEIQPRSLMEKDPTYKQIIPYLLFEYDGSFFLMQRKKDASEQRLQSKYSLGIGGHMRFEDLQQNADLFKWAKREFEEEVQYEGSFQMAPLGILNDDSTEVGQVHLGIVLMLIGDSNKISVKSELQSGQLVSLHDCLDFVPYMESWSQIALMKLLKEGFKSVEKEGTRH